MLAKVKLALRVSGSAFDTEIQLLIDACLAELQGLGIFQGSETAASSDPLICQAVIAYAKWQFGNNDKAERWEDIFDGIVYKLQCRSGYGLEV